MMPTRRSRVKRARSALRIREKSAAAIPVVFQVLPHTLGLGPEVWRVLSKCTTFGIWASMKATWM